MNIFKKIQTAIEVRMHKFLFKPSTKGMIELPPEEQKKDREAIYKATNHSEGDDNQTEVQ